MDERLEVRWGTPLVGHLTPAGSGGLRFSYTPEWGAIGQAVSLALPTSQVRFTPHQSLVFFANLLPEGETLQALCRQARLSSSDVYGFLKVYGQDCAGALTIAEEGRESSPDGYRDITDQLKSMLGPGIMAAAGARLSLAGAQDKLPVRYENSRFLLPTGSAPTTAILKPQSPIFPDLHKNEAFCMALAKSIGLPVPESEIVQIGDTQAYLVQRYDRKQQGGAVLRVHQEDFCQAMGVDRTLKYEEHSGPGFKACGRLLRHPSLTNRGMARDTFIRCTVFNYIIGNCDAHGKNFSLLHEPDICLAAFYDLVSTRAYPELEQKYAMSYGKTFRFDRIAGHSWQQFATDLHITTDKLAGLMGEVAQSIGREMESLAASHEMQYGPSPVYERILSVTRQGLAQVTTAMESLGESQDENCGPEPE